jgi:hypothetical protein
LVPLVFVDGIVSLLPELLNALGQQSNGDYILPPQRGHGSRIEIDSHELDATIMPLALINAEASVLVRCIQAPQFRELLCSEMFVTRRSICSSLLDTFLGGDCGVDGRYSDTRKLFAQILAEGNICEPVRSSRCVNIPD